jgi:anti-sigma B factor antagonist
MDEQLRVTVEPGNVVRVAGELDMATADEVAAALDGLASVTVECSELTFLDSSGLKVFVVAHKRALQSGSVFALVGLSGVPLRVVQMAGLETMIAIGSEDGEQPAA